MERLEVGQGSREGVYFLGTDNIVARGYYSTGTRGPTQFYYEPSDG